MSRKVRGLMAVVVGGVALAVFGVSTPAVASQGSVPEEVAAYASDPNALLATLDGFVGIDASGKGIDFSEGASVGALSRVFGFTRAWLAGGPSDPAVELRNEWAAPILIHDKPVGVAIIWINDGTVAPELADFIQNVGMTAALKDVPAEAWLVRDEPRGAWFTLAGAQLTVVERGTSGLSGTATLADYQSAVTGQQPVRAPEVSSLVMPAVLIGAVSLAIIAAVLVPLLRRRRTSAP